jgi:hypothetical protein
LVLLRPKTVIIIVIQLLWTLCRKHRPHTCSRASYHKYNIKVMTTPKKTFVFIQRKLVVAEHHLCIKVQRENAILAKVKSIKLQWIWPACGLNTLIILVPGWFWSTMIVFFTIFI